MSSNVLSEAAVEYYERSRTHLTYVETCIVLSRSGDSEFREKMGMSVTDPIRSERLPSEEMELTDTCIGRTGSRAAGAARNQSARRVALVGGR